MATLPKPRGRPAAAAHFVARYGPNRSRSTAPAASGTAQRTQLRDWTDAMCAPGRPANFTSLAPGIKRGPITADEEGATVRLHAIYGDCR
ncbi:unnamed protein product [Urochloa humidicola]